MPAPSRVNDTHRCGHTEAHRLSPNTSPVTARHSRQPISKPNARNVENVHTATHGNITDSHNISDAPQDTKSIPVSSNTPRIAADAPLAWHDEFSGGAAIGIPHYDSREEPTSHRKRSGCSESGEADAVVSVHDLGLSAVLPWSTHHSRSRRPSQTEVVAHFSRNWHSLKHHIPAKEIEDEMRHKIESNLSWSEMDQEEYLPVDSFEEIFSIETTMSLIGAIYKDLTKEELIRKAGQIWGDDTGSRRRIVATLVFMKQTSRIEDFIKESIFDHDLPLCHEIRSRKEFRTLRDDRVNTKLFQNWERVHIDLFYVYQKMIFVPFLSMGNGTLCSYVFDGNVRLPWDKFEKKTSGGHGTIHRLEIHQSHHDYTGDIVPKMRPCFAVKEINGADHESYRKELRALEQSCAKVQKEKHLIKLLLTFQHGNRPYLVFEWADGNLEEFWKRRQVEISPSATRWMAEQCRGISNAIKRIHGLATWQKEQRASSPQETWVKDWGRHGDIKPANILWFLTHGEDRDHLVVADLGLTRYHSSLTKSRVVGVDGYTGTYRAPEIDLANLISSKYDIWSLGCVFFEFCIWYLFGHDDVENFQRQRNLNRSSDDMDDVPESDYSYFVTSHVSNEGKRAELHPAVQQWVEKLRNAPSCRQFARQMLDLIMGGMLVIDPKKRHSIDYISSELLRIGKQSGGLSTFQGTTEKTYQSPELKSSMDHLQVPGSPTSLVTFAEGNSIIPEGIMSRLRRRDRALSIESSGADSHDGSWNGQSTAATSVFSEELDDHAPRSNMISS